MPLLIPSSLFAVVILFGLVFALVRASRAARRPHDPRVLWDVSQGGKGPRVEKGVFVPGRAAIWPGVVATVMSIPLMIAGRTPWAPVAANGPRLFDDETLTSQRALQPSDGKPWRMAQSTSTVKTCTHTDQHGDHTANHTDIHHDQVEGHHYDTHADGAPHADGHQDAC